MVPEWAVAVRQWEGALGDGAARSAGLECIRASRNYHLASARREAIRYHLARSQAESEAIQKKYQWHMKSIQRASRRLLRERMRNLGNAEDISES